MSPGPRWLGDGSLTAPITDLFNFPKLYLTYFEISTKDEKKVSESAPSCCFHS